MAGTHEESLRCVCGNPEGHDGGAAPNQVVFAAGDQVPGIAFIQTGVAGFFQLVGKISRGMINAVGRIQKVTQSFDSFGHNGFSLFYERIEF